MNTIQKGITTLLCCAITGESRDLPEDFSLEAALPLIRSHGIVTLIYEGAVRCGVDQTLPVMRELFQSYYRMMLHSEGQVREIRRLFGAFQEQGIDFMPLKGCKMKALYPRPELRAMGDADVLIRMEQYPEKIAPVMEALGFRFDHESDHEIVWKSKGLYLELHKRLIPSYNGKFFDYFGDGWQLARPEEGTAFIMDPEDTFLFLLTHFAKHYRDGGIGCRHVVDLWVYLRSCPDLDWNRLRRELEKLGLWEFSRCLDTLFEVWFGEKEADERTEFLTEFIFASGSWGQMEARSISAALRKTQGTSSASGGKLGYLRFVLFPGVDVLKEKYRVLQKAPWMLPLVWAYRPFYKVLFERKDVARHRQQMNAITQERLDWQIQLLHFVGLKENFE